MFYDTMAATSRGLWAGEPAVESLGSFGVNMGFMEHVTFPPCPGHRKELGRPSLVDDL
jgi:hypothetical protein